MAIEQQAEQEPVTLDGLTREEWIRTRMSEFATDAKNRDRALAMLLHDSLTMQQAFGQIANVAKKEGLGGMIKAVMGAMNGR